MDIDKVINIATDGSCDSRGHGIWSVVCLDYNFVRTGSDSKTTNARMELMAVCAALDYVLDGIFKLAIIRSDSNMVVYGINNHLVKWVENDFEGVKDADLWRMVYHRILRMKNEDRQAEFVWLRGNTTDPSKLKALSLSMKTRSRFYEFIKNIKLK